MIIGAHRYLQSPGQEEEKIKKRKVIYRSAFLVENTGFEPVASCMPYFKIPISTIFKKY